MRRDQPWEVYGRGCTAGNSQASRFYSKGGGSHQRVPMVLTDSSGCSGGKSVRTRAEATVQ